MSDDSIPTKQTTIRYTFDAGSARHRIGLIVLSTDEATERDFHYMLPARDVMFFSSRVVSMNPITIENLRAMAPRLTQAAAQILPDSPLDVIAYSCTSGTVALGYDTVVEQIQAGRPGTPVVTPITAAIAGFRKLGVTKISLLTPYIDSVNQPMRQFLEHHGISVLNIGSFCLESDLDMARLPPEAIHAAALETCHPKAEGLFISCTALRAAQTVASLEQALKVPVISSIQCLFWESLRRTGYQHAITGYGSLLHC